MRENLTGGNRKSAASDDTDDEFLLGTLRTCRLSVLANVTRDGGGLDGTLGMLSDGQKQVRSYHIISAYLHSSSLRHHHRADVHSSSLQLFCVARALVWRPKILVLDEATADLDQESANELLRVIADSFADITVISIAHRLNFIRDSDKILVLNAGGTVNAYDTPAKLLEVRF